MYDAGYRTQEEIDEWKARDPIGCFRERLLADASMSEEEAQAIDDEVVALIEDALEFAKDSPWPDQATATDHVFDTRERVICVS